jgi:hypothetical protein
MKKKLLLMFFTFFLVGKTDLPAQNVVEPHNVIVVKRLILNRKSLGIVSGLDHKQNRRLGDKAAQALLVILKDDFSSINPQDAKIYLVIIETAFVSPGNILDPSDRIPKVTFEFLEKLKDKIDSPEISKLIDECREFVQKKTKT